MERVCKRENQEDIEGGEEDSSPKREVWKE